MVVRNIPGLRSSLNGTIDNGMAVFTERKGTNSNF